MANDYDKFDSFIEDMIDGDYDFSFESWYNNQATEAQRKHAEPFMRELIEEGQLPTEQEQESEVVEVDRIDRTGRQPVRVYDTRESPRYVVNESGDAIVSTPNEPTAESRQLQIERESRVNPEQAREIQKRSIAQRLRSVVNFILRRKSLTRIK